MPDDGIAIAVAATVVSARSTARSSIDAGAKTLTKDVAPYLVGHGLLPAYPDAIIERVATTTASSASRTAIRCRTLGEVVAIIPNHVCPVIDLRDTFLATRSGTVVGVWPVDARGRSG